LTVSGTSEGAILGTAAYMSPEQARGKTVDKRTDIWAYGCVLYEMLTDRKAFEGETASDAIAPILQREPDWTKLPAAAPAPVPRLLRRCLEKDPNRRLRDIGDARLEVDEALSRPMQADLQKPAVMTRRNAISALAGAAVGAATGVFAIRRYRGPLLRNLAQFSIAMPEGEVLRASFGR
jgi:serine/threonine protein kinase